MIGKEVIDRDSNTEVQENKFTEIIADKASIADTKSFWNRIFDMEKEHISEDDLWELMLYCDESEFVFADVVDKETRNTMAFFDDVQWKSMDAEGRLELIEKFVACIGKSLGIKELPEVELVELEDDCYGYFSERGNYIAINTVYWNESKDVIDTVAHEMRHKFVCPRCDSDLEK